MGIDYMKAVEYDKLPAKFRKAQPFDTLCAPVYWLQPKYDGCFVKAVVNHGAQSCKFFTRTGETIHSMGHLAPRLIELAGIMARAKPDDFYEDVTFYGEAWAQDVPFPTISGWVRQHGPAPRLGLVLVDAVCGWARQAPYSARWAAIEGAGIPVAHPGMAGDPGPISRAFCYKSWDGRETTDIARNLVGIGGFDGAILRNIHTMYTPGLVKNGEIVKVKPLMSLDLRVTGVEDATGEKTGRTVYTIAVEYRGVFSWVGSGMPHDFADVPKIGQIVQIDCLGITADGKLREPRFIAIRHDKEEPDT